jgi:acyl-coenzyme A synthetase/AMP-(fatty) acid ligase
MAIENLLANGRAPDHAVAVRGGVTIPFARFQADVAAAAVRLHGCQQATLACADSYWFAVGLLALLHVGAEVLLPPNTQPGTLAELATRVADDALIAGAPEAAERRFPRLEAGRIEFYTSGSTGMPKRIEKSLVMLQREIEVLHRVWGTRLNVSLVLATVSPRYLYGLVFRLLWPLAAGTVFDAATDAVWETLLPKLASGAAIISSPAHLGRLAGLDPVTPSRRPSLIFSAGAPLTLAAATASETILGCLPSEIFGSTEAGALATRRQGQGNEAWTLLPDNEIRCDAEGRMAVRSPYVEGWQQTEDVVEPVADGFIFLGRADRIVKIEGERISLPALEAALEALPLVAAAAVVALSGVPLRLGGVLELTDIGQARMRALGQFQFGQLLRGALSQRCAPAGLPRVWHFTNKLPVRAMGKRNDTAIAALFGPPEP